MGAALRKQCCGGRDDSEVKAKAKANASLNDESWTFLSGDGRNDLTLFDEAHASDDIATLIQLMDSKQPFAAASTAIHPWASQPKSVGSLAIMQLATLASKEVLQGEPQPLKDRMREAQIAPKLVECLQSDIADRREAAVVCVSFFAVESEKNCVAMYEAQIFGPLIACMSLDPPQMRGAAADACRNIFYLDVLYRQAFVSAGGVEPLLALLDLPPEPFNVDELYNQTEAIFHIEDLILENAAELPQFVELVRKGGAAKKLEALIAAAGNHTLADDARGLLVRIAE